MSNLDNSTSPITGAEGMTPSRDMSHDLGRICLRCGSKVTPRDYSPVTFWYNCPKHGEVKSYDTKALFRMAHDIEEVITARVKAGDLVLQQNNFNPSATLQQELYALGKVVAWVYSSERTWSDDKKKSTTKDYVQAREQLSTFSKFCFSNLDLSTVLES